MADNKKAAALPYLHKGKKTACPVPQGVCSAFSAPLQGIHAKGERCS